MWQHIEGTQGVHMLGGPHTSVVTMVTTNIPLAAHTQHAATCDKPGIVLPEDEDTLCVTHTFAPITCSNIPSKATSLPRQSLDALYCKTKNTEFFPRGIESHLHFGQSRESGGGRGEGSGPPLRECGPVKARW
jgi:hypothetical protein